MHWLELHIDTNHTGLDPVTALLSALDIDNVMIDDEEEFHAFLEENRPHWDYVEEDLEREMRGKSRITFYLLAGDTGFAKLAEVRVALQALKESRSDCGSLLLTLEEVQDADWETSWKQYYKPLEIGERLLVIPQWETAEISTKRAVAATGVGLARERFIRRGDAVDPDALAAELGLPLFVKPNASGSSFGVTRVERAGEIPAAVERAFAESDEVLVEECIRGREMGCGVLIAGGREYLLPITEIRPKKEFFDFQAKYEAGYSDEITPAEIAPQTAAELHRLALAAYKACRCRGIVRVDFIVTPEGRPYLIEINTIPGMSAGSIVPKQVRAAGMTLGELYDLIIADTCGRKP